MHPNTRKPNNSLSLGILMRTQRGKKMYFTLNILYIISHLFQFYGELLQG